MIPAMQRPRRGWPGEGAGEGRCWRSNPRKPETLRVQSAAAFRNPSD